MMRPIALPHPTFSLAFVLLSVFPFLTSPSPAQDSRSQGRLGLGGQVGTPDGITTKYYFRKDMGIIVVSSINLEQFLSLSSYLIYENPIPDSPLRLYVGPGASIGRDDSSKKLIQTASLSVVAGLNFFVEKFEVFLQTNPSVEITPVSSLELGGAVGLRYYF